MANDAEKRHPGFKFVPVYYMGNEDADLDELGHFFINGEKFNWETKQTGAVGHMKIDDALIRLITRAEGQIRVLPYGAELMDRLKRIFQKGKRIQQAMLELVNDLFSSFGLVVMIADSALMKSQVIPVFEKELFEDGASPLVVQTTTALDAAGYKVQAHPREINLFYLADGIRNRIEKQGGEYQVVNTALKFSADEIRTELHQHPERFSPNVILRGIYQESILPNVAFVGGGGETAYWLQLKSLFKAYNVFFPVLLVRNSFLLLSKKQDAALKNMNLDAPQLFQGAERLMEWLVKREAGGVVSISEKLEQASKLYDQLKEQATQIDKSLLSHIDALKTQTLAKLEQLEKKFIRAEKRNHSDQRRQLEGIISALFPNGGLQERVENFMPFYGKYGPAWLKNLYENSGSFEQDFCIVTYK
ncbi:MAG: bacillithiol biosynthesis cysteine-adding enzyme BshC [Chitinophagaceae bacterium]|nr:bacillithiol biosynthesis cysteine-adding enzyme BshC [Chitinophagaceae bacterium]